jgi:hypothetical protein
MSDQISKTTNVMRTEAITRQMRHGILCHGQAAILVLRREMLNYRSSPANRIRAARILADMAFRTGAMEDNKAQLAQLELVDPQKEALKRLTPDELRCLRQFTADRDDGTQLSPHQVAIARKFAAFERDIRATKLRRLSRR